MKNFDYESLFTNMSLIFAIAIFVVILFTFLKSNNTLEFFADAPATTATTSASTTTITTTEVATGEAIIDGVSVVTIAEGKGGSGYVDTDKVVFSAPEGTATDKVTATGTLNVTAGKITSVKITNAGKGYTTAPTITVTSTAGKDFVGTAVLGAVTGVKITKSGKGYKVAPTVTFAEPPTGGTKATGTATISATGEVTGVTIAPGNNGSGYTSAYLAVTFQSPLESENEKNPIVPIEADKKDKILKLIEECSKLDATKKTNLKSSIENNALRKLEIDSIISLLST
jgi:hypothetical protein